MHDLNQTLEFKGSAVKLAGLLVLSVMAVILCGFVAFGYMGVQSGSFRQFIGWAGLLFFGFTTIITAQRLFTAKATLVTLSAQGITDLRVASGMIPWSAILDVGVWTMQRQKIIVMAIPPELEASIGLTRIARWSRGANKTLGADGLCVTAAGLKTSHGELLGAIIERVNAARGST